MLLDAQKLSEVIRAKKKKLLESPPDVVDTSPSALMNANDVYDLGQKGAIEETLDSPPKINADDTSMNETYTGVGLSPEEKTRMGRLRSYFDTLDI